MSTPLADALATVAGLRTRRRPVGGLHALPWPALAHRPYRRLYGRAMARADGSWPLDSFFRPTGPLAHAQRLAAAAFGADETWFGTCGTTVTNRIALDALYPGPGATLLLDPTSHQSLLLGARDWRVTAAPTALGLLDPGATEREVARAAAAGRPYTAVALTAASYDGRLLRLDEVLPRLFRASPSTAVLVDEAWTAVHAFVPGLDRRTALAVARDTATAPVLVTQSAHKTLAALRQGSYLHVLGGDPALAERLRLARLAGHTSSPSWPVLASLDLARAHAERHGGEAFARACALRDGVVRSLAEDPRTARVPVPPAGRHTDPSTLVLDVPDPGAARALLWERHGLHLAAVGGRLVARFHLGATRADARALVRGLRAAATAEGPPRAVPESVPESVAALVPGAPTGGYVIPYPPGVPLAAPDDPWTAELAAEAAARVRAGAEILHVVGRRR